MRTNLGYHSLAEIPKPVLCFQFHHFFWGSKVFCSAIPKILFHFFSTETLQKLCTSSLTELFFGAPRIFGRNSWTAVYSEASALVKNHHQSFANTRLRCHSQAWPETDIAGKEKWPRIRANSQHFRYWSRFNNKKCRGNIWSWQS